MPKAFILLLLIIVGTTASAELEGLSCDELRNDDDVTVTDANDRWRCHQFNTPPIDGTRFHIQLRWNRPGQDSVATAVWLAGGDGSIAHADFEKGVMDADDRRSVRQRLDDEFAIRSIELQFINTPDAVTGLGGYWAAPQLGFIKPAKAFMAALDYLNRVEVNLLQGEWLTVVGSSNGSTAIAFALAYLDTEQAFDRAVFISGPFWGDVLRECNDPDFDAYIGRNDGTPPNRILSEQIFADISAQNGWSDCRAAGLDDFQRSALGDGAVRDFPTIDISVIVGAEDEYGPWLINSNRYWYESISALNTSRTVLAGIDHSPWGVDLTTQAWLTKTIAQPPGAAAEGLFTVAGEAIFYSNGGHHCYFPTMSRYQQMTGRSDIISLPDYRDMPSGSIDDGICGEQAQRITGLFSVVQRDIYYSNGDQYCYFPTMELYRQLTGREDSSGLADYAMVPGELSFAGDCARR